MVSRLVPIDALADSADHALPADHGVGDYRGTVATR
jgi:hypothetical protein